MGPVGTFWRVPDPVPHAKWSGGELLALRAWRLAHWRDDGGIRLQSLSQNHVWHGPVFHSDHMPEADARCGSGVYAMKPSRRPRSGAAFTGGSSVHDWLTGANAWIWGWVALSGQVVEHAEGYRAQTATVRRLHLGLQAHLAFPWPGEIEALVRALENRYQCPVRVGAWETRKARRILSLRDLSPSRLPSVPVVGQAPAPAAKVPLAVLVRPTPATPARVPAPRTPAPTAPSSAALIAASPVPSRPATRLLRWTGRALHRLIGAFFDAADWVFESLGRIIVNELELLTYRPK